MKGELPAGVSNKNPPGAATPHERPQSVQGWLRTMRGWILRGTPYTTYAAVALASLGLMWLLLARDLHDSVRAETLDAQRHLEQIAGVGAQSIQSATRAADLQLLELRQEWLQRDMEFDRVLASRRLHSPIGLGFEATILDRRGQVVFSTSEANRVGTDLSALESFRYLRDRATDELWVARHVHPTQLARSHLDFSRPLLTRQGQFEGVIICGIESDYLVSRVKDLGAELRGVMSLVSLDGATLMQLPAQPGSAESPSPAAAPYWNRQVMPVGALLQPDGFAITGAPGPLEARLLAWRKAADYPLFFVIENSATELTQTLADLRWRYVAVGSLLSIVMTAGLYWSMRHHLERDRTSREQAAHLLQLTATRAALTTSQRELSELSSHQLVLAEEERKRIAREIHDELGQRLTVHRIDLAMLADAVKTDPARLLAERVNTLKGDVDAMLTIARDIAHKLRPAALDIGLGAAVESLLREFNMKLGIACELTNRLPSAFNIDESAAIGAFRILQEALTNAARHANPQRVRVALWHDEFGLALRVHDDGCGFDPNTPRFGSFGLSGMRERATALGGYLEVVSSPGLGTSVQAHIPMTPRVTDAHEHGQSIGQDGRR